MIDICQNFIQHHPHFWSRPIEQGHELKNVYTKSFTQYELHLSHQPLGQGHRLKVYSFTTPGW